MHGLFPLQFVNLFVECCGLLIQGGNQLFNRLYRSGQVGNSQYGFSVHGVVLLCNPAIDAGLYAVAVSLGALFLGCMLFTVSCVSGCHYLCDAALLKGLSLTPAVLEL